MSWRVARRASRDIDDIWRWIAPSSRKRADDFVRRLEANFALIGNHPQIGRLREELGPHLRSMPFGRYIIFFRLAGEGAVEIVRVLHGARDIGPDFFIEE